MFQVAQQAGTIMDGTPGEAAQAWRSGGDSDQATSLGQGHDAGEAGEPRG